ncbi:MAG: hypothetical protein NC453_07370 [Muribaculum sp.]|nr:hypothetical protein [Muribaculum sp.]
MQILIEFLAADLAEMLMEEYGWDMLRALDELYHSKTFEKVNDPKCGLYYQGPVYVFGFLKNEIETGKIA